MPNYTGHQLEMILTLSQTLNNYPLLRSHRNDFDHLKSVSDYMYNHVDENNYDMAQLLGSTSKKAYIGSEGVLRSLDFERPGYRGLKGGFRVCIEDVEQLANDENLMRRQPMLKSYLGFAKMIMQRGSMDHPDRNGYASDVIYNTVSGLFNNFEHVPTQAEMERLRTENPHLYEVGTKIMNLMNDYVDFNAPEMLVDYQKADQKDRAALEQERLRRLNKLQQSAQAFSELSYDDVKSFYLATGTEDSRNFAGFEDVIYSKNSKRIGITPGIAQLSGYKKLLEQGVTLEESRLLWDTFNFTRYTKKEVNGLGGFDIDCILEPLKSKWKRVTELSDTAQEKYRNGFASPEEKEEFFRNLGTAYEELGTAVKNYQKPDIPEDQRSPELQKAIQSSGMFCMQMLNETELSESIFHRSGEMRDRLNFRDRAKTWKWADRVEVNPCITQLLGTKTGYLGNRDSKENMDYRAMMDAVSNAMRMSRLRNRDAACDLGLGENCRNAVEKGTAYMNDVLSSLPITDRRRLDCTRQRFAGTLGIMRLMDPQKAEEMRKNAAPVFGRELSWNEIRQMTFEKPNFIRYYELHTGNAVQNLPDNRLGEYLAKSAAAMFFFDDPNKKFSVDIPRKYAAKLQEMPDFKAAMRAVGPETVREVLRTGDRQRIAEIVNGGPRRYAVSNESKTRLQQLAAKMNANNRSKEWTGLKAALENGGMQNSRKVFSAVEDFLKGKKSVSRDPVRRQEVKLALDALAIVAENGDEVAKARAQILVDRFNQVRRTHPGQPNYIDIRDFGHDPEPQVQVQGNPEAGQPNRNA